MPDWGLGKTLSFMERALDAASIRQRLLADNIANVETPGYKRKDLDFSLHLRSALAGKTTHPLHIPIRGRGTDPRVIREMSTARNDGNNVDIEVEIAESTKNALYHQAISQQISRYLNNLKRVVTEGRR